MMVKLVDTQFLGSCGHMLVWVRFPLVRLFYKKTIFSNGAEIRFKSVILS